jgi:hypothetical protein
MKKQIIYIVVLGFSVVFFACKPDAPALFNDADGVYFNTTADSMAYSFAKYPSRTVDTLKLPVSVLGSPAGTDREITIESLTGAGLDAKEGVHYKLLPPYKMPANQVATTVPVAVYRTGDLDSLSVTFKLAVKENKSFGLGITTRTSLRVKMGFLQKPSTWGEFGGSQWAGNATNFGTWTKTKYKLILEALYDPVSDTTVTEFPYLKTGAPAISLQYLQMARNYIRDKYPGNYTGVGATIRDPEANNALIVVGPANY